MAVWSLAVVGSLMHPPQCPCSNPWNHESVISHDKTDFADVLMLRTLSAETILDCTGRPNATLLCERGRIRVRRDVVMEGVVEVM